MSTQALPLIPWPALDFRTARNSRDAAAIVLSAALDIMILGFPSQANRLVDAVHQHIANIIEIGLDESLAPLLVACAWEATKSTPEFVRDFHLEENERKVKELWPVKLREKYPDFEVDDIDFALANLWDRNEDVYDPDFTPLAVAVEVAVLTGHDEKARELVEKNVVELYRHYQSLWNPGADIDDVLRRYPRRWLNQRLGIGCSSLIWNILKDGTVGKALQVDEEALNAYVDEGCRKLAERRVRPYANKTIRELVVIMDENYVAAQKAGRIRTVEPKSPDEVPSTLLNPPATEQQISELEERLAHVEDGSEGHPGITRQVQLPEDYKEFLRITNGFSESEAPIEDTQADLFHPIDAVARDQGDLNVIRGEYGVPFELFPYQYTLNNDEFDNINFAKDVSGFTVGRGGDEGMVLLIEPRYTKEMLGRFERVYEAASEQHKEIYEAAASDLYGGIDALREMEWLVVVWYHWNPTQQSYRCFKDYLELEAVPAAVDARRTAEEEAGVIAAG